MWLRLRTFRLRLRTTRLWSRCTRTLRHVIRALARLRLIYRRTRCALSSWWLLRRPRCVLLRSFLWFTVLWWSRNILRFSGLLCVLRRMRSVLRGSRCLAVLRWLRNVLLCSCLRRILLRSRLLFRLRRAAAVVCRVLRRPVHRGQARSLGLRRTQCARLRGGYDCRPPSPGRNKLTPVTTSGLLMLRLR